MAASALRINCVGLASHQRFTGMHLMAGRAGDLILRVAALETPHVGRLIQMAGQTDLVGHGRSQFCWIPDVIGRGPLGVCLTPAVTGLARPALPSSLGVRIDGAMRARGEPVIDILVTDLASLRTGVARRKRLSACVGRGNRRHRQTERHCEPSRHVCATKESPRMLLHITGRERRRRRRQRRIDGK